MLGREVLWLLAVADDVDGLRRRGLTTHVKNPVKGATLPVTKPQAIPAAEGARLLMPAYGRAAPANVEAYQPVPIGIFSTSIPVCGASMM